MQIYIHENRILSVKNIYSYWCSKKTSFFVLLVYSVFTPLRFAADTCWKSAVITTPGSHTDEVERERNLSTGLASLSETAQYLVSVKLQREMSRDSKEGDGVQNVCVLLIG